MSLNWRSKGISKNELTSNTKDSAKRKLDKKGDRFIVYYTKPIKLFLKDLFTANKCHDCSTFTYGAQKNKVKLYDLENLPAEKT